jgi:tetratricopeptide (TPR) repeat protein
MKQRKHTLPSLAIQTLMDRGMLVVLVAMVWVSAGMTGLAQSGGSSGQSSKPASSSDNPFPGDTPQAPAPQPNAGQQTDGSKAQAAPKKSSDNPFPGEDSNAPIIPTEQGTPGRSGSGNGANSGVPGHRDPDGDPVRSPDGQGRDSDAGADDGFSSSLSGVNAAPAPDTAKAPAPVPAEDATEDVNVGQFYLDRKNWRAAQSRFAAAFAAEKENPDAVWGLAEAERHLGMLKEADEHYKLFLTYDPTGPHGKAARKAVGEVEAELNLAGRAQK